MKKKVLTINYIAEIFFTSVKNMTIDMIPNSAEQINYNPTAPLIAFLSAITAGDSGIFS